MKGASVKVRALAGHQQLKNMWIKSEKFSFTGAVVMTSIEEVLSWSLPAG
jgi:hypothetical protein